MLVEKVENTTIITQYNLSINELVSEINSKYSDFENDNIIIHLDTLDSESIDGFINISDTHREAKQSFVLVNDKIDIDAAPEELVIVPTLQEAHDIIEMEEIERDLGF